MERFRLMRLASVLLVVAMLLSGSGGALAQNAGSPAPAQPSAPPASSGSSGPTGIGPSSTDPLATVNTLLDVVIGRRFSLIGRFACDADRADLEQQLDIAASLTANLPSGADVNGLIDTLTLSIPDLSVSLISNDGSMAVVDVKGTLKIGVDEDALRVWVKQLLEQLGEDSSDAAVASAMSTLIGPLETQVSMSRQVKLAPIGGVWLICEQGAPAPSSPVPSIPAASMKVTGRTPIAVDNARIISMSPDGTRFVAASPAGGYSRGSLCTYSLPSGARIACADLSVLEAGLRIEDIAWSPDGSKLVFAEMPLVVFRDGDLWLMDAVTGALTNLDDDGYSGNYLHAASSPAPDVATVPANPVFTPDGSGVTYSRSYIIAGHHSGNDIVTVPVTGGQPRLLVHVTTDEIGVVYDGLRWAPDGSRLYYSVNHNSRGNADNGIWVVNADGSDAHLLVGAPDADSYGPAVLQVAGDGAHLLSWDPAYADQYQTKPVFAVVDTATGQSAPLVPLDSATPPYAYVSWAAFSPDGHTVMTLNDAGYPILDVRVRDVGGTVEYQLVNDPQTRAGWIGAGIPLTWSVNGTAFITGGGAFGTATLLSIGDQASPIASPSGG